MLAFPKPTGLFLSSLVLALLAVVLLSGAAWGINLGIWSLCTAIVLGVATRSVRIPRSTQALGGATVFFALLYSLRNSNSLRVANGFALTFCLGSMLLPLAGRRLREATLSTLLGSPLTGVVSLMTGALGLSDRVRADREAASGAGRRSRAIFRGMLFAAPLLIVFGALFASADAIFRNQIESLGRYDLDPQKITEHLFTFSISALVAGGLLYRFNLAGGPRHALARPNRPKPLGMIEGGVVLGSLAALFGSFLLVQFRYLFGAKDVVRATHGLSFAEYARGGFFELVVVAALTLVVLVGAESLVRREKPLDESLYRWLGRILGGMVYLIVGSALIRMHLYTEAFGLTELRVYATVFMLWLVLAFAWLFATTLCGHPERFAFGLLLTGLGVIALTNFANPDRIIVETNLSKPNADFGYLATLGNDATLALRDLRGSIPPTHQTEYENLLHQKRKAIAQGDWRELNFARLSLIR